MLTSKDITRLFDNQIPQNAIKYIKDLGNGYQHIVEISLDSKTIRVIVEIGNHLQNLGLIPENITSFPLYGSYFPDNTPKWRQRLVNGKDIGQYSIIMSPLSHFQWNESDYYQYIGMEILNPDAESKYIIDGILVTISMPIAPTRVNHWYISEISKDKREKYQNQMFVRLSYAPYKQGSEITYAFLKINDPQLPPKSSQKKVTSEKKPIQSMKPGVSVWKKLQDSTQTVTTDEHPAAEQKLSAAEPQADEHPSDEHPAAERKLSAADHHDDQHSAEDHPAAEEKLQGDAHTDSQQKTSEHEVQTADKKTLAEVTSISDEKSTENVTRESDQVESGPDQKPVEHNSSCDESVDVQSEPEVFNNQIPFNIHEQMAHMHPPRSVQVVYSQFPFSHSMPHVIRPPQFHQCAHTPNQVQYQQHHGEQQMSLPPMPMPPQPVLGQVSEEWMQNYAHWHFCINQWALRINQWALRMKHK